MQDSKIKLLSGKILTVFLIAISFAIVSVINNTVLHNSDIIIQATKSNINRAHIYCYAIEESYSTSIDYLVENYGISLKREIYIAMNI